MSWIIILKGKNSTYSFGIGSQQINQNSNFQCCKMLLTNNSFYYQIELNVRACAHVSFYNYQNHDWQDVKKS